MELAFEGAKIPFVRAKVGDRDVVAGLLEAQLAAGRE
ncbi:hypothetical protein SSTU70S_02841 [Stutzerimonas stutzeri]